jgi:hypothetical protein
MKTKPCIFLILFAGMFAFQTGYVHADAPNTSEYKMKAAYIYKFLQFVQLPETRRADDKGKELKTLVVGVTDKNLLPHFRAVIGNKEVTQHETTYRIGVEHIDIKQLTNKNEMLELDVLFIKDTSNYDPRKLFETTVAHGILTFSETEDFIETGGNVNFVVVKNKLKFEINTGSTQQTGIKMRSQLLKLAIKIIDKKINRKKT